MIIAFITKDRHWTLFCVSYTGCALH